MKNTCVSLLLLLLSTTEISANPRYDRSIDELVATSNSIVTAEVVALKGDCRGESKCAGYHVTLEVSRVVKGSDALAESADPSVGLIETCTMQPLTLGYSYTLFIDSVPDGSAIAPECSSVVALDGAFVKIGDYHYREGSADGATLLIEDGKVYLTSSVRYEGFLENLNAALLKRPDA